MATTEQERLRDAAPDLLAAAQLAARYQVLCGPECYRVEGCIHRDGDGEEQCDGAAVYALRTAIEKAGADPGPLP